MTGLVTDIGIELGKLVYWNLGAAQEGGDKVRADRARLRLLSSLLGMFLAGAIVGAFGFKHAGFVATVPLATILVALAVVPVLDDLRGRSMRVLQLQGARPDPSSAVVVHSMRHQDRHGHRAKHGAGRAAQHEFLPARVAVAAHDDEIRTEIGGPR